jgi:flotillin
MEIPMLYWLIAAVAAALILIVLLISVLSRYKRCPSDKILVIFGRVGKGSSSKCVHGGAAFIWPIIQDYKFLDLAPLQIEVPLKGALSKQQIRVAIPSNFTIGISTEGKIMPLAAERLLALSTDEIKKIAGEIIIGQLRQVVATMNIEDINADREKFLSNISKNVETELEKIGLRLINVNITDIKDESGYIEALGKNAAAEAINNAKKAVAEKDRDGSVGAANALQEQRVKVANADASAVTGENLAKVNIANSTADLRERSAEANKRATAAEKVQSAKALEESYKAEQAAETARAERERATQTANVVVAAEIGKKRIEIDAEAEAEKLRREAKGQADAIFLKLEAQARGAMEILTRQAEGLKKIVDAAGGDANKAATLLIVDKLDKIVSEQVKAIQNLKIDKVTVWDNGTGGKSSTANFLSSLITSLPPLQSVFEQAGMKLPDFLSVKDKTKPVEIVKEK